MQILENIIDIIIKLCYHIICELAVAENNARLQLIYE